MLRGRHSASKIRLLIFQSICGSILAIMNTSNLLAQDGTRGIAQRFLEAHCVACHDGPQGEAGLDLSAFQPDLGNERDFARVVRIFDRVAQGEMPPSTEARPAANESSTFLATLGAQLTNHEQQRLAVSGRTPLRRLNRVEYENTIREVLGVDVNVKDILPPDTPSDGFDTVAVGLRFSQLQMEKYLEAADVALDAAIDLTERPERFHRRLSLKDEPAIRENLDTAEGTIRDPVSQEKHRVLFRELPDAVVMFSTGYPPGDFRAFNAPVAGKYRIRMSAYAYQTDGSPATLRLFAHRFREKRLLGFFEMPSEPREVELIAQLERNELVQVVPHGVGFDRRGQGIWNVGAGEFSGSGLAFQWLEIEGPLGDWPPSSVRTLYPDVPIREIPPNQRRWREQGTLGYELAPEDPASAARRVVEQLMSRAVRRPLEQGEAEPFVQLALRSLREGDSFEQATRFAFRAILTAPQFLFLDERPGQLDDHALASRLSYFLGSGPPDDELRALASAGKLRDPNVLRAQTDRLLSSSRASEFVKNFTGQWLDLRSIKATSPDKQLYPEFDELLEHSMVGESEAFFSELLAKNESITNIVHSNFLMLNRTMAAHYKIGGVTSERFERVELPVGNPRGGVLTQAAVLKVTANGTVTSPVMRGAWVQKRIMGQPPQPPPPNVGSVEPDTRGSSTIRELLDKHRNSESCAGCHSQIDPPGFALESFDVIGGWRERYRSLGAGDKPSWQFEGRDIWEYKLGPAVDSSGELSDGRRFENIMEFKQHLLKDPSQIVRSLTKKLVAYGTGSSSWFSDRDDIEKIVATVDKKGNGLRTLIHEIVQSPLFQSK
ncbi:MAG: DUF1592 domain-containing protein [Planctomycetaceae bacterium]|nr:DUF1592 domain-containing protein [Planctomycetaceae bacterium]